MFDLTGKTVRQLRLPVSTSGYVSTFEITAKQGDVNSRFLEITMTDENGIITISAGAAILLNVTRSDGQPYSDLGEVSSGKAIVRLSADMLAVTGRARADVSVIGVDANSLPYVLSTVTFYINVVATNFSEPVPVANGTTTVTGSATAPTCYKYAPAWTTLSGDAEGFAFIVGTPSMSGTYTACFAAGYFYFLNAADLTKYYKLNGADGVCTSYTQYIISSEDVSGTILALAQFGNYKTAAETAAANALTYKNAALAAQTASENAQGLAEDAQEAAELAETHAKTSETNAATSEINAGESETSAAQALSDLIAMIGSQVATLDANGKLTPSQIPAISLIKVVSVVSEVAMLELTSAEVQPGDVARIVVDGEIGNTYLLNGDDPSVLGNWAQLGDGYVAEAGHSLTADAATDSQMINGHRVIAMTQTAYNAAVTAGTIDANTIYIVGV